MNSPESVKDKKPHTLQIPDAAPVLTRPPSTNGEARTSGDPITVSEVRYRRLFETAKDGILILDSDTGAITDANPFISELLGYSHGELVGKQLWEIGLFGDQQASKAAMRQLQETRYIRYEDLPLKAKSGSQIDVEFVSNVYSEGDRTVIQCNIRDISERKRVDDELRQAAADLSEVDRHKNEFLAMLAHELRNPLAAIRNSLEFTRITANNSPGVKTASAMMDRQVGNMVRLVDDLLDISRISLGKIQLRKEPIDLATVVSESAEAAGSLAQCKNQDINITLPGQPIYVNADPTRMTQVVGNLLSNACKFSDKGGRISLTVTRENDQGVICVRDTGIGISAGQLSRVFDMFMQADISLERSAGGLGIGLTLVKNLVELHGGTVEACSAGLGQGSEFKVRLPAINEASKPPPDPTVGEPTSPPRRVLVVDDNSDSAESLAMLLDLCGNQTHIAYDGVEALQAAATFKPDVMLVDLGLPKLNGYEVARKIRQRPGGDQMLLIALTGWGQDEDRRNSKAAGFDEHLVKPVNYTALTSLLAGLASVQAIC